MSTIPSSLKKWCKALFFQPLNDGIVSDGLVQTRQEVSELYGKGLGVRGRGGEGFSQKGLPSAMVSPLGGVEVPRNDYRSTDLAA